MNVVWIAVISVFVLAEKVLHTGRLASRVGGILLVLAGIALLVFNQGLRAAGPAAYPGLHVAACLCTDPSVPVDIDAAYYRDVVARNGLTLENETQSRDTSYSLQARTKDGSHRMSLDVLNRSRDTFIRLGDSYTLPRP